MAKKTVTKKQEVIILLLYIFRFVNSKQIQEFLAHKDHRRINSWLKDLTTKGYIERDFTPIYGTLTKPAVYHLSILGRKYMKDTFQYSFPRYLKRIARDKKTSKGFRIKCQILADWYIMLFYPQKAKAKEVSREDKKNDGETLKRLIQETVPSRTSKSVYKKIDMRAHTGIAIVDSLLTQLTTDTEKEEKIPLNTTEFFTPAYVPPFILFEKITSDGYIRRRVQGGLMYGFFFIIDAYIPRFLLRYTCKRIFESLDEEYWEDEHIHSLNMYFLCPNNQLIIYMKRIVTQSMTNYYSQIPLTISFATRNQLYTKKEGRTKEVGWKRISSNDI